MDPKKWQKESCGRVEAYISSGVGQLKTLDLRKLSSVSSLRFCRMDTSSPAPGENFDTICLKCALKFSTNASSNLKGLPSCSAETKPVRQSLTSMHNGYVQRRCRRFAVAVIEWPMYCYSRACSNLPFI